LIAALLLMFAIQMFYYLYYFVRIIYYNRKKRKNNVAFSSEQPPVSVVVYSKNESESLAKFLPAFLTQDYPNYQIIVVNDGSTDESDSILQKFSERYPHLYRTFLPIEALHISTKKMCLTVGIKAAKHDIVLFTNADCSVSEDWLSSMMKNYTPGTDVVLGYATYARKKSFLEKWISFDLLFSAIQFMSKALLGNTYMSAGQNLSYRKKLFFAHKGFASHLELPAGEDDLFVRDIATRKNVRVEVSPESTVHIHSQYSFRNWRHLKENTFFSTRYYKEGIKLFRGIELFSRFAFYALLGATAAFGHLSIWTGVAVVFLIRYITQLIIINRTAKQLGERKFYLTVILFDILQPIDRLFIRLFRKQGKRAFIGR
jgi:glycosyltransferase involved in cell wall biosynthesis